MVFGRVIEIKKHRIIILKVPFYLLKYQSLDKQKKKKEIIHGNQPLSL